MGHRLWLPTVAIHRLGVIEIAPFPHHCFRTATPVRSRLRARQQSQSSSDPAGKDSATSSPILMEAGTSVRLSFQSRSLLLLADESSGVTVHEALPRLQSASSWLVMDQLVYGVCRLSCTFHAAGNSPPNVRRSDTGQQVYTVQVRWFEATRDDSAAVM